MMEMMVVMVVMVVTITMMVVTIMMMVMMMVVIMMIYNARLGNDDNDYKDSPLCNCVYDYKHLGVCSM